MKKFLRLTLFLILGLSLLLLVSCSENISYDARALAEYMQWFAKPEQLPINAFEKAEFDGEIFYYLDRGPYDAGDDESVKLIIVYNTSNKTYKTCFWLDMEYGLNTNVKAQWEARGTSAKSTHVFTEEEIASIAKEAAEYCNKKK